MRDHRHKHEGDDRQHKPLDKLDLHHLPSAEVIADARLSRSQLHQKLGEIASEYNRTHSFPSLPKLTDEE